MFYLCKKDLEKILVKYLRLLTLKELKENLCIGEWNEEKGTLLEDIYPIHMDIDLAKITENINEISDRSNWMKIKGSCSDPFYILGKREIEIFIQYLVLTERINLREGTYIIYEEQENAYN